MINVNKVTSDDNYWEESFQKDKLKKWFSIRELDLIETAFECSVIIDSLNILEEKVIYGHVPSELGQKAIDFGKKYKTDKKRLLAILENILENGTFKP